MAEIIIDLDTIVSSTDGHEYYVQVAGEQRADGTWQAWLEFVPLDDLDVLVTAIETTQPSRENVVRWSETLTGTYLQGAFGRAVRYTDRGVLRDYATEVAAVPPFDPFDLLPLGKSELRARLRVLTRAELLGMIRRYDLNPAGKSLVRLTDSQLVTFILTAVEVQALQGRH